MTKKMNDECVGSFLDCFTSDFYLDGGESETDEVQDDEMNDETDEVLIRSALCRLSAGFLHFISPLHPPPAGQQATSQSALLRGLFNNVEGERRETKWERKRFSRRCGSPLCDIYLKRGPECVCAV